MRLRADHSAVVAESPGTVLTRALNGLPQIGFSNWPGQSLGASDEFQFSVPPVMAASPRFCWRCATSKAKACVTPAI